MLPRLAALRIEARREIPRGLLYATPLLAVALPVLAGFLLFLAMGYDPGRPLYHFFLAPPTRLSGWRQPMVQGPERTLNGDGLPTRFSANLGTIAPHGHPHMGTT